MLVLQSTHEEGMLEDYLSKLHVVFDEDEIVLVESDSLDEFGNGGADPAWCFVRVPEGVRGHAVRNSEK